MSSAKWWPFSLGHNAMHDEVSHEGHVTSLATWKAQTLTTSTHGGLKKNANILQTTFLTCIFLSIKHPILNKMSFKFIRKGTTANKSALVQVTT